MDENADLNEPRLRPDVHPAESPSPSTMARRAELDVPHTPSTPDPAAITAALEQARRGIAGE